MSLKNFQSSICVVLAAAVGARSRLASLMAMSAAVSCLHGLGLQCPRGFGAQGGWACHRQPGHQRAIEAAGAERRGGGTVFLPAGHHSCGSIRMKSNIDLHLDAGAHIIGLPADSKEYDPSEAFNATAYQDGGHTFFHNSLIWGRICMECQHHGVGDD